MSVRAYAVIKFEREESPAFNLWDDDKFMVYVDDHVSGWSSSNDDGSARMIEISAEEIEAIREAVTTDFKNGDILQEDNNRCIEICDNLSASLKRIGGDFLMLDCF